MSLLGDVQKGLTGGISGMFCRLCERGDGKHDTIVPVRDEEGETA